MKSWTKRRIALALVLTMLLGLFPANALAVEPDADPSIGEEQIVTQPTEAPGETTDPTQESEQPELPPQETEEAEQPEAPPQETEDVEQPELLMPETEEPEDFALELMSAGTGSIWTGNEWNSDAGSFADPDSFRINREDAHTSFFSFQTEEDALASQQIGKDRDLSKAAYQCLDTAAGNVWKFYHVNYPYARKDRPDNANIMNTDYDDSVKGWDEIKVPSTWEFTYNADKTFKYNPPQYSNTDYAWNAQNPRPTKPHAPTQFNPVGFYRTTFTVDEALKNKEIFLNFDGVESALYVWVNGQQVGFSMDSFTGKEFKIDQYLVDGENTLAVEVFKWSSGSWMEDQDMLRLSGIFRSVYLTAKESVEIRDYTIVPTHAGAGNDPAVDYEDFNLDIYVNLRDLNATAQEKTGLQVEVSLYDPEGNKLEGAAFASATLSAAVNEADFEFSDSLGRDTAMVELSAKVKSPLKWTAESPNLYKAVITLRNSSGEIVETTAHRFGFRDLTIINQGTKGGAQVLLNGQPLLIKGVNTQEMHPTEGRALSSATIRWDLTMMKQNNFNAVRMSHYSHDYRFYDYADEIGLYVMEETNIETHGDWGISGDSYFLPAFLDRVSTMYYRSKNYPSVVMLSLGNEAGGGVNHQKTANWLNGIYDGTPSFYQDGLPKGDIQNRPIHYEGNSSYADINSNMYPRAFQVDGNCKNSDKPYILCEYEHSLGNSVGYYQEYWNAFDANKNSMGGYIWDWVDQGVLTYQTPDSFPAQNESGFNVDAITTSQDANRVRSDLSQGTAAFEQPGQTGDPDDKGLRGAAVATGSPEALDISGSLTLEAWIYPEVGSRDQLAIIAKGNNTYQLKYNKRDGHLQLDLYGNGWTSLKYKLSAEQQNNWYDNWHHVAVTYDMETKTANLYYEDMDTVAETAQMDTGISDGSIAIRSDAFAVGRNTTDGNSEWIGLIDNVRVYNKALTAAELANTGRTASDEGVAFWNDFNDIGVEEPKQFVVSQDELETRVKLEGGTYALQEGGHTGKALSGAATALKTPKALNLNAGITLEAWVKPKANNTGFQTIFSKGDHQYQLKTYGGYVKLDVYGSYWNTVEVPYDQESWAGRWHHIVARYDPETMRGDIFIDDMSEPAGGTTFDGTKLNSDGTFNTSSAKFAVGRDTENPGSRDWIGLIDDVRVYNRTLTNEEIADTERTASDDGVVYWQDFDTETTTDPGPSVPPTIVEEGYWGFGGDWGDQPNSDNFCANGIVSPDRVLRGSMLEIKRIHQDYVMKANSVTASSAVIDVRSRARFTDASAYDFVWQVKEDGVVIREGTETVNLAPLATGEITVNFDEITPVMGKEYLLTVKFLLKDDVLWAEAGHEISAAQIDLDYESGTVPATNVNAMSDLTYMETDKTYVVTGKDFKIMFDRTAGSITSFIYKDKELFVQGGEDANGPTPNFWRAPTDNDRSSMGNGNIKGTVTAWRYAGRDRTGVTTTLAPISSTMAGTAKAVKISVSGDLAVTPNQSLKIGTAIYTMAFTIYSNGQVEVENTMTPEGFGYMGAAGQETWERNKHIVPAVGNLLQLPAEFENLTWFGQGSDTEGIISESYKGREEQQFVDVFSGKVSEQSDRYNKPQTTGNKMGVRWVALTNDAGMGLMASAISENLQINAQHKTPEMLTTLGSAHPYEVAPMEDIALTLDNRQLGVGYDPGFLSDELYHGHTEDIPRPYQKFAYSYMLTPVDGFTTTKAFELSDKSYEDVPLSDEDLVAVTKALVGASVEIPYSNYADEAAKAAAATKAVQAKIDSGVNAVVAYATDHFVLTLTKGEASATVDPFVVTVEAYEPPVNPPSSGGSSNTTTETKKNEDGSTTKTVTDKKTGNVTETTTYPDGTKIVAVTPKDGKTSIEITVPKGKENVTVTIPTNTQPKPGDVAVILHEDGTREIVKSSVSTPDGLRVTLDESCKLEIVDNSKSFADVPADHWGAGAIAFVSSRELFTGTGSGFDPAGNMSRAMLFTVLARLDGQDITGGDTWYTKAMDWAKETGVSDGTNPEANITRESLAVMLYRYAGSPDVGGMALGEFSDAESISTWASNAMLWCVDSGILNGNGGKLNPGATATRAEVAAMLQRFVQNLK